MKMSEVSIVDLKNYANVTHTEDDKLFSAILIACKGYIKAYTGLSDETIDLHEDLTIALYVLASEMYDNRAYTVENDSLNPFIKNILHIHAINHL